MRRLLTTLAALAFVGAASAWVLTRPETIPADLVEAVEPDLARGEQVFWAAGCASCHAAPEAGNDAKLVLSGGYRIESPFGTFVAPNISTDPEHGIGSWSRTDIVTAIMKGTSPQGSHLYPAFPYGSYVKAELSDMVSLAAFLQTLPADPTPSQPHDLGFPFNIRLGIGLWKFLYMNEDWAMPASDPQIERGRYLAEALSHCGECHTPRDALGGLDTARWFAGAPNPSGKGRIPNITPKELTWSAGEIAEYLSSGFTPSFDTAGGNMAKVVQSLSHLTDEDRAAIAAYVKSVPAAD